MRAAELSLQLQNAERDIYRKVKKAAGAWLQITQRESAGIRGMEVMPWETGKTPARMAPYLELTRRRNGSIECRKDGKSDHRNLHITHSEIMEEMRGRAKDAINGLLRETLDDPAEETRRVDHLRYRKSDFIDSLTDRLSEELRGNGKGPAKPGTGRRIAEDANEILNTHILNDRLLRAAGILHWQMEPQDWEPTDGKHCGITEYNLVAKNEDAMLTLADEAPNLGRFYCRFLAHTDGERGRKWRDADELAHEIREAGTFSPAEWRLFCQWGDDLASLYDPNPLRTAKEVCQTIVAANVQEPEPKRFQHALKAQTRHKQLGQNHHWVHGDHRMAWAKIVNRYLRNTGPPGELDYVAVSFSAAVRENLPWGDGDWNTLMARAQRWHEEAERDRQDARQRSASIIGTKQWQSLLGQHTDGKFELTPLNSAEQLSYIGAIMGNCLTNYQEHCASNRSRIYTIREGGKLLAAAELRPGPQGWTTRQIERPRHGTPSQQTMEAARRLALRYDEAARKQSRKKKPEPS